MSYVTTPIANRNFLSPGGFDLVIEEAPKVQFFCQISKHSSNLNDCCRASN